MKPQSQRKVKIFYTNFALDSSLTCNILPDINCPMQVAACLFYFAQAENRNKQTKHTGRRHAGLCLARPPP